MSNAGRFHKLFERWARRIRMRMGVRRALTGAAIGLLVGALAATLAWKTGHGSLRPWMASAGAAGVLAGLVWAVRKRWTDSEVALYLDGRLGSNEAITTAVELRNHAEEDELARAVVVAQAADALEKGDPKSVRPAFVGVVHLLIPAAAVGLVLVSRLPIPVAAAQPPPPGSDQVQLIEVQGLEKVAALEALQTPDDEQRKRLKKIAEDAKKLRKKLEEGMERREALAELARIRDAIAAERMSIGDGERRAGLEAARGRLAQEKSLRRAADALGDRDLTRFDEEMQKLANQHEKRDRDAAKKALEEAAEAARRGGAKDVAKALEEQKKLFEERSKRGEALREFGKAFGKDLPPEARKDLEDFGENGLDKDAGKLAERMADALEKLTPEERKRLAERMRKNAENAEIDPMAKEQMRDFAKKLETPEGQKELEEMLRKMANEPPKSEEAEREKALEEAERGSGECQGQLGAPMPVPMQGGKPANQGGKPNAGKGKPNDGKNQGGPGSHNDKGRGDHEGSTDKVEGDGFRARAGGKLNPGAPMPGVVTGRGKPKSGEPANIRGENGIGEAAPSEIGGVDRSEIPEEYREQVGRYFKP